MCAVGQSEVSKSGLSVRFILLASDRVNMGMSEVAGGTSPKGTGASEARPSPHEQPIGQPPCNTLANIQPNHARETAPTPAATVPTRGET